MLKKVLVCMNLLKRSKYVKGKQEYVRKVTLSPMEGKVLRLNTLPDYGPEIANLKVSKIPTLTFKFKGQSHRANAFKSVYFTNYFS